LALALSVISVCTEITVITAICQAFCFVLRFLFAKGDIGETEDGDGENRGRAFQQSGEG
jgi:hypothetical protein